MGFPARSDKNQGVHPQKMARGLKFWIQEVEGLYYLCSENKGIDEKKDTDENKGTGQQGSYCTADLRLCFRICENQVFLMTLLNYVLYS